MTTKTIKLCPEVYRGGAIKKKHTSMPAVSGFDVPIKPLGCVIEIGNYWEVPIQGNCDPFDNFPVQQIRWAQRFYNQVMVFPPFYREVPRNQWDFQFTIPSGWLVKCPQCFGFNPIKLIGTLGFNAGSRFPDKDGKVSWEVYRDDLPFPGEKLIAITVVAGDGDMRVFSGPCTPAGVCATGDCVWSDIVTLQTSGKFLEVAYGYFATPTWTGGDIAGYKTTGLGEIRTPSESEGCPLAEVYGDSSLRYLVNIEGEEETVGSSDFAGYGLGQREGAALGSFVLARKIDQEYVEPYNDGVLGAAGKKVIFPWHINSVGP